jgi:PAS domain
MGQGVLIVDVPMGKLVYANDAVADMTGPPARSKARPASWSRWCAT